MSNQDIDPKFQTVYDKIAREDLRIFQQSCKLDFKPEPGSNPPQLMLRKLPTGWECSMRLGRVEFGGEK